MRNAEVITTMILFKLSGFRTFKHFYIYYVQKHMGQEFPKLFPITTLQSLCSPTLCALRCYTFKNIKKLLIRCIFLRVTNKEAIYKICIILYRSMKAKKEKDPALQQLGDRIKSLRIQKGYSSYEYFAYEHNISRAQFGRYERGEDLRFSSLAKIIAAFGMTFSEFFAEGFENSPSHHRKEPL